MGGSRRQPLVLSLPAPIEIACEAVGVVRDTFHRWYRAGRALHLGEESPDIPPFLPRQPDEADDEWLERKYFHDWECAHLEDIFLTCTQTRARARLKAHEKMYDRALNDKQMYSNAWFLERTMPEDYALVTTNRREVDIKAEITHKSDVEAFAELYALLGHGHKQALPPGDQTRDLPERDGVVADPDPD